MFRTQQYSTKHINSNLINTSLIEATIVKSAYYEIHGGVFYKIKNGICYVFVNGLVVNTVAQSWQIVASGLPKASETWVDTRASFSYETKPAIAIEKGVNEYLRLAFGGTSTTYYFVISYPIANI